MSNDDINASLRLMRDLIRILPLGASRDAMQARFDLTVSRIAAVPDRVMAQYDAGTCADSAEVAAVWRLEMFWALAPLEVER